MKYAILEVSTDDFGKVEYRFEPYDNQEEVKAAIKDRRFNPRSYSVLEYQELIPQVETTVNLKRPGVTRSS